MLALLSFGRAPDTAKFDPRATPSPSAASANLLVAPAARWDSVWYLSIAHDGYGDAARTAFFPLYPLLAAAWRAGRSARRCWAGCSSRSRRCWSRCTSCTGWRRSSSGASTRAPVVLADRVLPDRVLLLGRLQRVAVPGRCRSARSTPRAGGAGRGRACSARWRRRTRSAGVLLVVPLVLLYLYGPRGDRPGRALARGWRPRYPVRADLAWVALVPVGLAAFLAYLRWRTGDAAGAVPRAGRVVPALRRARSGRRGTGSWRPCRAPASCVSGSRAPVYFAPGRRRPVPRRAAQPPAARVPRLRGRGAGRRAAPAAARLRRLRARRARAAAVLPGRARSR